MQQLVSQKYRDHAITKLVLLQCNVTCVAMENIAEYEHSGWQPSQDPMQNPTGNAAGTESTPESGPPEDDIYGMKVSI